MDDSDHTDGSADTDGSANADRVDRRRGTSVTRRRLLVGGAAGLGVAGLAAAGIAWDVVPGSARLKRYFKDTGPDGTIPDVANGDVRLERRHSAARGRDVDFFTAVPDGHGDGTGLPVCLVLHGATGRPSDFERFGFGRFLTAAVHAGAPPFVLAGADGGTTSWGGDGRDDDPQTMLRDEIPSWCGERGFDTDRMVAYGWSMGGYGVLLTTLRHPGWLRRVAALSPAVGGHDEVMTNADRLVGSETGIWCGTVDALYPNVQALAKRIPGGPAVESYSKGAHTRGFWDRITPDAFAFVGAALA